SRSRVAAHPAPVLVGATAGGSGSSVSALPPSRRPPVIDRPDAGRSSSGAPPRPPDGPDPTRLAPPSSPRRNVNPSARRRAIAAFVLVLGFLGAMVAAAILLAGPARTTAPSVTGLSRADATAKAHRSHLGVRFGRRWSSAAPGTVIAQSPRRGTRVKEGSAMRLVVSRGLAPVQVPLVVQESSGDARASLRHFGLGAKVAYVVAPGIAPGTVVRTSPRAGTSTPAHSTVSLFEAETPSWRSLTSFTGRRSEVFSIRGRQWRIVYKMGFQGTCTWIFFCSGPHAQVVNAASDATVGSFGLNDGGTKTQTLAGPGEYQIRVVPGGDDARWSVEVQDYY
ncbi:MAG: PASTA domain-containing protein, partial [Solirubrobacteraceae bacterium]